VILGVASTTRTQSTAGMEAYRGGARKLYLVPHQDVRYSAGCIHSKHLQSSFGQLPLMFLIGSGIREGWGILCTSERTDLLGKNKSKC